MESSEEQHLSETSEIYLICNIINVFIITFKQFKASLLNTNINLYTTPPPPPPHQKKKNRLRLHM